MKKNNNRGTATFTQFCEYVFFNGKNNEEVSEFIKEHRGDQNISIDCNDHNYGPVYYMEEVCVKLYYTDESKSPTRLPYNHYLIATFVEDENRVVFTAVSKKFFEKMIDINTNKEINNGK